MFSALFKSLLADKECTDTEDKRRVAGAAVHRAGWPPEEDHTSPFLRMLKDGDLERLNCLLPWSSFIVDWQGRQFGKPWSSTKRALPQEIPDRRIVELHRRFPLTTRKVLEIGCFEGIHTIALSRLARQVIAVDSRIENVVKTIVRCAVFGESPTVLPWNAEERWPAEVELSCDVLHHVGVLYHLVDPVGHLNSILPHVIDAVMLDTHVAPENAELDEYAVEGRVFRYLPYREGGREEPFAGMSDHAKWLLEEDLIRMLHEAGFDEVDVAERRNERNGPRLLIYAARRRNR